ncbi:MAG TPA: lysophospholipase, partial [Labilithrix sp.]|nr:lysophospholipase [Labilithrix sp.]
LLQLAFDVDGGSVVPSKLGAHFARCRWVDVDAAFRAQSLDDFVLWARPSANDMTTAMERFPLRADDGFSLSAMRWLPAGRPRAIVQISHGCAEHAGRYASFAEACVARGLAVYAHDHRGHGGSIDENTPRGHYADHDGWSKVVGDLGTVNRHARAEHPDLPVFLLGHSMGSFIARAYLIAHGGELAGAILSATGWRAGVGNLLCQWFARRQVKKLGVRTPSPFMSKLIFGSFNVQFAPTRTHFDWLSRDPKMVDSYIADPLCGFDCTGKLWEDLLGGAYALEKQENQRERLARLPLFLLAGTRDPVSIGGFANTQILARYRAAGNTDITNKRYPGARHEMLNETNREEVTADLLAWIDARVKTRVRETSTPSERDVA